MQAFITTLSSSSSSMGGAVVSRRLATLVRPGLSSSFPSHPLSTRSNVFATALEPTKFLVPAPAPALPLASARSYTSWAFGPLGNAKTMPHRSQCGSLLPSSSSSSSSFSSRYPISSLRATTTRFTSSTAPRSSATASTATATATAATGHTASTATVGSAKTLLSHHEEMTKVRFSYNWWKEWTIIMTVFAITGSSSVYFVKPILKNVFQLEGSMQEGPWSYRLTYVCTTMPTYSVTLLAVASLFGRRPYFQKVVLRMWSRFLPKKVIQRFQ